MKKNIAIVFILFGSAGVFTSDTGIAGENSIDGCLSAVRFPNENLNEAMARACGKKLADLKLKANDSPVRIDVPLQDLDLRKVNPVRSKKTLFEMFRLVRDSRDWVWADMPDFPRRLTWLYPFDGCYMRSQLMIKKFEEWGYPLPSQIHIFGNLMGKSEFGDYLWWYHVAPAVSLHGRIYVIDPALDHHAPLLINDWIHKMDGNWTEKAPTFSICSSYTIHPLKDACESASFSDDYSIDSQELLPAEWNWVKKLKGENQVFQLLGEHPPWE